MSRKECVDLLEACSETLRSVYGITSLRLFGSTARDELRESSDVDVFVETLTPNPFLLMEAKEYLEKSTGRSVDIIRNHRNLNPRLRKRIERDGITIFWTKNLALDILYDIQSAIDRLQERTERIHTMETSKRHEGYYLPSLFWCWSCSSALDNNEWNHSTENSYR